MAQRQDQGACLSIPRGAALTLSRATRAERLRDQLVARLAPVQLVIEDESHLHAGHAGADGGLSHYRVRIVAEAFRGLSAVARHRLIYAAVDDMLKSDIHALAIEALTPPPTD